MPIAAQHIKAALTHLRKVDPIMKQVIRQVGPFTHRLNRSGFDMLVNSILSQQISVAAAKTIRGRLKELVGGGLFKPDHFVGRRVDDLREVGVSRQKAGYLLDLAGKVAAGAVSTRGLGRKSNEEIIQELTQVKGIGVWTAQMFLMFSLGRLDVFPIDDLGIQNGMKRLYQLGDSTDRKQLLKISDRWAPYQTVACWYCWQSLDNAPA